MLLARISFAAILMLTVLPGMAFSHGINDSAGKNDIHITLTIEGQKYAAVLYDNPAATELASRLPQTLTLGRGGRDYCGDISPLQYEQGQIQTGYRNGQLAYWIPGQDFVIFMEREESSSSVDGVVILGEIHSDFSPLFALGRSIQVTIDRAQ